MSEIERPDCDICGHPSYRHNGHYCPIIPTYRAKRPDQPERVSRLEEALKQTVAFIGVMCGVGPNAIIPETISTPLGVDVKIGAIMRAARSALNQGADDGR